MELMRGDMGGAATVLGAALAIAKLKIPINYVAWCAFTPCQTIDMTKSPCFL
jgi:aminopeptidase